VLSSDTDRTVLVEGRGLVALYADRDRGPGDVPQGAKHRQPVQVG